MNKSHNKFIFFVSLILAHVIYADTGDLSSSYYPNFHIDDAPLERPGPLLSSYSTILKEVIPTVVGIYTKQSTQLGINEEIDEENILNKPFGVGSGLIIDKKGFIITNSHVILDEKENIAEKITVELQDKSTWSATLVAMDKATDLAILKVNRSFENSAVLGNSSHLEIGDIVFAIGNPHSVGLTVTMGIISAKGRSSLGILGYGSYENFIQTDAAINFGNSGGPLIDAQGRVIGINTAIYSKNGGNIGLGFSAPINLVKKIANDLIRHGIVVRGYIGVLPENISKEIQSTFNIPEDIQGAFIRKVQENLPAAQAGLKAGDIITEINGRNIKSAEELRLFVSQNKPGNILDITVYRLNRFEEIEVKVSSLSNTPIRVKEKELPNVITTSLNLPYREAYQIPDDINGILVISQKNEDSDLNLLHEGMVIQEINDRPITKPKQISSFLRHGSNRLYIWNQGNQQFLRIYIP